MLPNKCINFSKTMFYYHHKTIRFNKWHLRYYILIPTTNYRTSLIAQWVKNPPAMQETWVQSLGQEDPLEKEMATHSSFLTWSIPEREDPDRLQSMGLQDLDMT